MKLGYSSATAGIYNIDEAFRFADELNLNFIEITYDYCDFLPQAQLSKRVKELKASTGIDVTLHLPFIDLNIASLIKAVRKATVEQTLCALEYAEAIEASCGVLHTGHYFIYQPVPKEDAFNALRDSLGQLQQTSIPIALENLGLYMDGLIREPENLRSITDEFNMRNCLDFGHAVIEAERSWREKPNTGEDMIESYCESLGNRVIHLHLCNNNGQDDLHSATSQGVINYKKYQNYLNNFKGTICLEVAGGKEAVRESAAQLRSLEAILVS